MGSWVRSCLQSALKMVNSVIGLVGMGMIMYSMWMFRSWYKHFDGFPSSFDSSPPWFIYTFLGLGIFHCLITCAGLIAAETVNIHCLSCYMSFVFLLIVSESAITADIYLNKNWEEDFPEDPTGKFDEFNRFVRSNQEMCKWIGLLIVAAQVDTTVVRDPGATMNYPCAEPGTTPQLGERPRHAIGATKLSTLVARTTQKGRRRDRAIGPTARRTRQGATAQQLMSVACRRWICSGRQWKSKEEERERHVPGGSIGA